MRFSPSSIGLLLAMVSWVVLPQTARGAEGELKWQPYEQPGFAATRRAQFEATEMALTNRLQHLISQPKPSEPLILAHLQQLINVCVYEAKYDQAAKYSELAIRYADKQDSDKLHQSMLHCTLGKLLTKQSRYSEAQIELQKAAAIAGELEPVAQANAMAKINLAVAEVLTKQQRFSDAEKLYLQALQKPTGPLKYSGPNTTSPPELVAFAECLVGLKKYDDAEARIREALKVDLDELGAGQPALAADYNDLACVLYKESKLTDAEKNMAEAVRICRAFKYKDLPDWVDNLARVLNAEGKQAEAGALRKEIASLQGRIH